MEYITFRGIKRLNEAIDPELLSQDELPSMVNMYLDGVGRSGVPKKRGAFRKFNTNDSGDIVYSIHDTKDRAGANYVLAGVDTKLKKSLNGTGAWSDVKTGLTADTIFRYANGANGTVIATNGTDKPLLLGGSAFGTVTNLEIDRPPVTTVGTGHGAGGNLTASKPYHYVMVYETLTGERSAPSQPFTHYISLTGANTYSTDAVNKEITITGVPVPTDSRVARILFFRTKGISADYSDARVFYYAFYLNVGTTSVRDTVADTSLDTSDTIVFTDLPSKAKYCAIHQDRLFLANLTLQYKPYYEPIWAKVGTAGTAGAVFSAYSDGNSVKGCEPSSNYKWRVSWVDSDGKESGYIETATFTTSAAGADPKRLVDLVGLPFPGNSQNAPPIKQVKIYRTKAGGSDFYLVETLDYEAGGSNIANTYRDEVDDSSLTIAYAAPATTKDFANTVVYSEILQPSTFPLVNLIDVFPDDGDEITGLMERPDGVVVFKRNSIRMIATNGSPYNWQVYTIVDGIGCDEPNSLVINGNRAFFMCQKRVYRFDGGMPVLISEAMRNSWSSTTAINAATYLNSRNWVVFGVVVSSAKYLYIWDEKIESWYKFSITAVTSLKEKVHGSNAGTLLIGDGNYLVKYDETQAQDNEAASTTDYASAITTKTFTLDGNTLFRIRRVLFNIKQYANATPSSEFILTIGNDKGVTKAMTFDSGASGITDYLQITDGMSGSLKETAKAYVSFSGLGLDEFHSLRLEYRLINRGRNIAR